jgi:hypothetical protein
MELRDVVAIGGKPGLHKIVGRRNNGLIVESIDDRKKRIPTSLTQKVSILDDISMYTYDEDVRLSEVLKNLDTQVKGGLEVPVKKDGGDAIRDFFRKVLPNFDEDQVYVSDILKLCSWYKILDGYIDFQAEPSEEGESTSEETKKKAAKPKAKPTQQKVSAKSAPAKAPKVTQRKMS